jgi:hypothetical protein
MAMAEDLSVFFDTDDFAVSVNLDGSSVDGILSLEPIESNFVQTTKPVFVYEKADKPSVTIDSTLIYDSIAYKVKGLEPDGTGMQMLILEIQ